MIRNSFRIVKTTRFKTIPCQFQLISLLSDLERFLVNFNSKIEISIFKKKTQILQLRQLILLLSAKSKKQQKKMCALQ